MKVVPVELHILGVQVVAVGLPLLDHFTCVVISSWWLSVLHVSTWFISSIFSQSLTLSYELCWAGAQLSVASIRWRLLGLRECHLEFVHPTICVSHPRFPGSGSRSTSPWSLHLCHDLQLLVVRAPCEHLIHFSIRFCAPLSFHLLVLSPLSRFVLPVSFVKLVLGCQSLVYVDVYLGGFTSQWLYSK